MKIALTVLTLSCALTGAHANDLAAGKARVDAVCAACHGANGVSVADHIPNLAGQKRAYLVKQLEVLKDGLRKNPLMTSVAMQLNAEDIANVSAFYASLPGAPSAAAKSELLPSMTRTAVSYPEGYATTYTQYATVNRPDIGQVRHLYANAVALQAARDGKPLPDGAVLVMEQHAARLGADKKPVAGSDGYFQSDKLLAVAVMARGAGWGQGIPAMLRNDDWNYAVFTPAKQPRAGVNQAECLACHKPLDHASYTFSLDRLAERAKRSS
jgi:cytochrome c553